MDTKRCFKCGAVKAISEFYKHSETSDGHLSKCKECTKQDVRNNYRSNRAHYRAYEVTRFKTPHRKQQIKETVQRRRLRHPEKEKARSAVSNALRSGRLKRQPCSRCGFLLTEAHHPDYVKPLDVVWLCFECHRKVHGQLQV